MPPVFQFFIRHTIIGFILSAVFVAALLWLNVANLWHLISTSDIGVMALFLLWFFNGIVFAGAQTGIAVMMMAEDDDDDRGPGGGTPIPIRVTASSPNGLGGGGNRCNR